MKIEKKKIILIIGLLLFVGLIVGGTFAYWTWNSEENKSVVFNTVGNVSDYIIYDEGSSYFLGDFKPTDSYCESVNTTVSFYKTEDAEDIELRATINMDVNAIGTNIANSSDVYWVVTKGDNSIACSEGLSSSIVLGSGTFYGKMADETIKLVTDIEVTTTLEKYTVWIWINSNGTDLSKLSGETVDTNVWTQIDMVDPDYDNNVENNDNTYTITYNVNGGVNGPVNQDKETGESVTISSTVPTRIGYTFSGWNTIADGSGTSYSAGTTYSTDADLILYAVWTPNTYTISYNSNGGSGTTNATSCSYGKSCTLRNNAFTKTGYTFIGWTDSETGTEVVYEDEYTILLYNQTSNMTLYALWKINTYTVSYNANYGTGEPSDQVKTYGETLTLSETVPTRDKHQFVEWNTKADGSGTSYQPGDSYSTEQVLTLYAIWEMVNEHTVSFNANGGAMEVTTFTTVGESTYTAPYTGTYKLEVWGAQGGTANSISGGYGGYSVGEVSLSKNDMLYINVGGKGSDGVAQTYYTSAGGYNGGGSGYVADPAYYVAGGGGATHIANTSGQLSTLSSNLNSILIVSGGGGGVAYNNSTARTYDIGHGGGSIGNTSYGITASGTTGYASGGTQNGIGTDGEMFGGFGYGATGTKASRAGGGGGLYGGNTNVYSAGGGSGYIGNSLLTNKAMYCYECTTSSDASTLTYSTTNVSATPTANYAKSGDGAARISKYISNKIVSNGSSYGTLPTPIRERYRLKEWNTKSDGTGDTITSDTIVNLNDDQTLYAIWELDVYTVNYDANGGSGAPTAQIKYYGETLTLSSTVPTRSGYAFLGWSTDSSATSATYSAGGSYTVNADATLYAVWCGHSYSHTVTKPTLTAQGYTTHTCTICGYSYKDSYTSAAATGSTVNGSSGYIGRNYTYSFTFTTPDFSGTASSVTVSLPISGQGTTNIGVYYYLSGTYHGSWEIYNNDTTQSKTIYATIYPNTTYTVSFEHWSSYPYGWGIVTGKPSVRLG